MPSESCRFVHFVFASVLRPVEDLQSFGDSSCAPAMALRPPPGLRRDVESSEATTGLGAFRADRPACTQHRTEHGR